MKIENIIKLIKTEPKLTKSKKPYNEGLADLVLLVPLTLGIARALYTCAPQYVHAAQPYIDQFASQFK